PRNEVVHLSADGLRDSRIAVEAAAPLDLPQPGPDFGRLRPVGAEEEHLKLGFLQPIELGDHRCPPSLNQWSEQPIELEKVLADTRSEHHTVIEATRCADLIARHLAPLDALVPVDLVDERSGRLTHNLQAWQWHLDQLPLDEPHEAFVGS